MADPAATPRAPIIDQAEKRLIDEAATIQLTERQQRFVDEYMIDLNAGAAYLRAGYKTSKKSAEAAASRLLSNVKVLKKVQAAMLAKRQRNHDLADRAVREIGLIALARMGDGVQYGPQGVIVLEEDERSEAFEAAVMSVTMLRDGPRVILHDKTKALDMLMKHLGLYKEARPVGEERPIDEMTIAEIDAELEQRKAALRAVGA